MLSSPHYPQDEKPGSQQAEQSSLPAAAENRAQVLVVEDDPQMARMIAATLATIYRVSTACDGQEGIEQALALRPDLILCDVLMPRMSGEQLVTGLRARPDFDDVPIVVLSGHTDEQLRIQLLRSGAQDYLVKPFNREELRTRVANLLMMRQARQILQGEVAIQTQNLVTLASEVAMSQRELALAHAQLLEREARLQDQAKELEHTNSELRRQRDELILLNSALREANRGRQFFSILSHELRTPLASIIGFSQLLLGDAVQANWDQQQQSNLERILKNAQHLLALINDALDLQKIEAGQMEVAYTQVNVRDLLTRVVEEIQSIAIKRNLILRADVAEEVDSLESNPVKLRQVLLNLVSNALKFSEQGEVLVSATQAGADHIAFAVRDTGIGIPADHQERIFEAFYQVDGGYTRKVGGTGLGLPIASQLTTLLGGKIELTSAPGQGSTFTVILPIKAVCSTC